MEKCNYLKEKLKHENNKPWRNTAATVPLHHFRYFGEPLNIFDDNNNFLFSVVWALLTIPSYKRMYIFHKYPSLYEDSMKIQDYK